MLLLLSASVASGFFGLGRKPPPPPPPPPPPVWQQPQLVVLAILAVVLLSFLASSFRSVLRRRAMAKAHLGALRGAALNGKWVLIRIGESAPVTTEKLTFPALPTISACLAEGASVALCSDGGGSRRAKLGLLAAGRELAKQVGPQGRVVYLADVVGGAQAEAACAAQTPRSVVLLLDGLQPSADGTPASAEVTQAASVGELMLASPLGDVCVCASLDAALRRADTLAPLPRLELATQ